MYCGNLKLSDGVVSHVHSPEVGKVNEETDTDCVTEKIWPLVSTQLIWLILWSLNSEKVTISFISAVRPFTLASRYWRRLFVQYTSSYKLWKRLIRPPLYDITEKKSRVVMHRWNFVEMKNHTLVQSSRSKRLIVGNYT